MIRSTLAAAALAATGLLTAGIAQARDNGGVQWSISIAAPTGFVFQAQRPVVLVPAPQVYRGHGWRHVGYATRWDRDGDGIPNRYDRVYNPRWDRDGDGIPNRYDRVYNPRWDRDGDGIPNRRDHRPNDPRNGRGR